MRVKLERCTLQKVWLIRSASESFRKTKAESFSRTESCKTKEINGSKVSFSIEESGSLQIQ